jgi:2'-5' RNA ligase
MFCQGGGRTLSQFALVSYIPGGLARFLDDLRLELTPACNPHAHVTILPPRPIDRDLHEVSRQIADGTRLYPPFEVELGEIEIFPTSNVIFVSLARGEHEVRALHGKLDCGPLAYNGPFPYHPHITIAQDFDPELVDNLARTARERWAGYDGPRQFAVETMSFVQHVAPGMWVDVAQFPLAVTVSATR